MSKAAQRKREQAAQKGHAMKVEPSTTAPFQESALMPFPERIHSVLGQINRLEKTLDDLTNGSMEHTLQRQAEAQELNAKIEQNIRCLAIGFPMHSSLKNADLKPVRKVASGQSDGL